MLTILKSIMEFFVKIGTKTFLTNKVPTVVGLLLAIGMITGTITKETGEFILVMFNGTSSFGIILYLIFFYIAWFLHGILKAYREFLIQGILNKHPKDKN